LRERKRYLAFEIISKDEIVDFNAVSKAITASALSFLGEKSAGEAGIRVMDKYAPEKHKGLIKINNKYLNELKTSLALISTIANKEVIVRSLGVSAVLKKAENKYIAG
jgi:RNase P/RNase MRP subunit POP5